MGRCALIQHMLSQGAQPWHRNPQWPKSPLLPHYDVTDGISTTRSWWHQGPIPFPRRATWAGRRQPHTVLLSPPPKTHQDSAPLWPQHHVPLRPKIQDPRQHLHRLLPPTVHPEEVDPREGPAAAMERKQVCDPGKHLGVSPPARGR